MTYHEFKNKYNGRYVDYDKHYGPQCWDLGQAYFVECLELPTYILQGSGLVSNMLVPPKRALMDEFFDEVPMNRMEQGDVVIWNWGHIAVYDHYENDKCYYFSQNPGPCHIEHISSNGGYAFRKKGVAKHNIGYRSHLQDYGWQDWVFDGNISGTTGEEKRLEAIQIDYDGEVKAKAHIQDKGWVEYPEVTKETIIGTVGEGKRLECLCLKGNFEYRVHLQDYGWSPWTEADGVCTLGTVGQGLRIEAIEIKEK